MVVCRSCAQENPDRAKFCMECGTPLAVSPRPDAEERKVVTSLFCDLVGFTAASERADPEDVNRMLAEYFAMARTQIELHGGVVEKFIGDAVVGLFGVPAAHEDDPERAVRAGLRITEVAEELQAVGGAPLRLRVGIDTGEALVRLTVPATSGEGFLTGDAVNTAARIQTVAPEMGVAVGLATYAATADVFEYQELEPATLKGKSEPVRVFHARNALARFGSDLTRTHDTPFIGREIELALLKGTLDKTLAASSAQLVTVVGEPGLGKSRLVAELGAYIDSVPGSITWRQGRCLPYGDGITFWALGEIVKAHAGILETDAPDMATSKLDHVLPEGAERAWFRQRLLPLLGIEATSNAEREELFAAWRRFFEHVAAQNPTVLVFEDLHWADEAMLEFLGHLAGAEAVPLLVIGTTRPELFERCSGYASGLANVTTIEIARLTDEETTRLVSALLDATDISAELQQPILERAGGNPLYAEEFVRLLRDKDMLVKEDKSWQLREGTRVPFPESIQALIAARLDTLSADAKSMLADAAVIGKVFWAGAIARMGDRDLTTVIETLRDLSDKQLVRSSRRSSFEGQAEYAFWHILARDVAYGQLPRASRASRHVAAASWIQANAAARIEDLADVLAYHYWTAYELAAAAGQEEVVAEVVAPALRFLSLAGERSLGLDTSAAITNLERALALAPPGHPERPLALIRFGQAARHAARHSDAVEALEEALVSLRARGDDAASARAMLALATAVTNLGDPRVWTLPEEAFALLEPLGPSPDLVLALGHLSSNATLQGRPEEGATYADRALKLTEEVGQHSADALGKRGMARAAMGDAGGLDDQRAAIVIATEAGEGHLASMLWNNLGVDLWSYEGPAASLEALGEGISYARALGIASHLATLTQSRIEVLFDTYEHDEALEIAADVTPRLERSGDVFDLVMVHSVRARVLALRGQGEAMVAVLDWLESAARGTEDPQLVVDGLGGSALVRAGLGREEDAAELIAELASYPGAQDNQYYPALLPAMTRTALAIGQVELAWRLPEGLLPRHPYAELALLAADAACREADGSVQAATDAYASAADGWERFGVVPEQAFALLGKGRCLLDRSRWSEAAPALRQARAIFARLRANPSLEATDLLLHQAIARG